MLLLSNEQENFIYYSHLLSLLPFEHSPTYNEPVTQNWIQDQSQGGWRAPPSCLRTLPSAMRRPWRGQSQPQPPVMASHRGLLQDFTAGCRLHF